MSTETLFITKSRIRRELLAALFTAGTDRHYVRELERTLGYVQVQHLLEKVLV